MSVHDFPWINASLNGASAALLAIGYVCIRNGRWRAHAVFMTTALVTSAAFLACYLTYHAIRVRHGIGITRFPESRWKPFYLVILGTHSILAVVILPLVLITLSRALRRRWALHRWIARITLPMWFYVSLTGVAVYWMLYQLAPKLR